MMPPKTRGQPPKKCHNISGLQNNSPSSTVLLVASFSQGNQTVTEEDDALITRSQESDRLLVCNKEDEVSSEAEDSEEETDYAEIEWDELDDQDFAKRMAEIAMADDQIGFLPDCMIKKVNHILHVSI